MVTTACGRCEKKIDITGLEPGDSITCPYCSHEFLITRQFGEFIVSRQLGVGGMGTVYMGRDFRLNRQVAVKVLKPALVSDRKFMDTFLREAEITASLNHPNIVQVYAFSQQEGVHYLVMEYISGGTLDDKITDHGRITELEGIEIGLAVARGLECARQHGLIHRDIKPGNILFSANNTPKIVDFGLSFSYDTTDFFHGEIWGTPHYVAPEKLEHEKEDFRSDLYSLGATLFHALSGRTPYQGDLPNEVAAKHLSGSVVSLKAYVPSISDQTAHAISKALARKPEDRYKSYAAFIEQLEDAKRRLIDSGLRHAPRQDLAIIDTVEGAKYQMWLMIGMLALIVGVCGLVLWKGAASFQQKTAALPSANDGTDDPPVAPASPAADPGAVTVTGGTGGGSYQPGPAVTAPLPAPSAGSAPAAPAHLPAPGSGGVATTCYQDSFNRSGDVTGSSPDVTNTGTATWSNTLGSGQYPLSNGTASISPSAYPWSAEYLPVNGPSGITLDGTRDFTLSVIVTAGSTGCTGISLNTAAPGGLFGSYLAALSTCSGFAGAYAFNDGTKNYNYAPGISGPTTVSLAYSASAGTLTYTVGSTTVYTQTGVTPAEVSAIRYVAMGDDGYGNGAATPAPTFKKFTLTVGH